MSVLHSKRPEAVVLQFSEPVGFAQVKLAERGSYTVAFRVTSDDGPIGAPAARRRGRRRLVRATSRERSLDT